MTIYDVTMTGLNVSGDIEEIKMEVVYVGILESIWLGIVYWHNPFKRQCRLRVYDKGRKKMDKADYLFSIRNGHTYKIEVSRR